ncbi:MAG TPA: hypothetical protein VGO93_29600 [Candidatus Xenobia bacterium]|jgi:hypothetical protein
MRLAAVAGLALLALTAVAVPAQATIPLLVNGDFETICTGQNSRPECAPAHALCTFVGDTFLSGWTVTPGGGSTCLSQQHSCNGVGPEHGCLYLKFNHQAVTCLDEISQCISTTPGHNYTVTWFVAKSSFGCSVFDESFGAQTLNQTITGCSFGYVQDTACFTATGSMTPLTFSGGNTFGFLALDNVQIVDNTAAAAAPEPGVPLMLTSLLGLALARRVFAG